MQTHWIATPRGKVHAQVWTPPASDAANQNPSAPALVLWHDSLGSVALWRDLPSRLCAATGLRVIAFDRLGFGLSDARQDHLQPDFIATEHQLVWPALQAYVQTHWNVQHCILLGHSVGGGMAVYTAAAWPQHVLGLITIAAQAFVETRTTDAIAAAQTQFRDPAQLERLAKYHGAKAQWVVDAWTQSWLNPAFAAWTLDPALAQLNCPVLIIHGDHDEYGSKAHPERILAGLSDTNRAQSQLALLPDTYHVPHREHPQTVLALIRTFIATVVPPTGIEPVSSA